MITAIKNRLQRFGVGNIAVIGFKIAVIAVLILKSEYAYCFNVSPARIEITVAASKAYDDVLIVKNLEKKAVVIKVRIEDWFKAHEGVDEKNPVSFNWLEISPLGFELKPGQIKEVAFKVKVPKKATGELNAMIFVEGRPKEIAEGSIGINTSIGIPIYVVVKGTERLEASVEDVQVLKRSPLELALKIKNSGNVHIRPTGTIEIINTDAHRLKMDSHRFTIPLNEYNYPILPNSSRTLEIRSNDLLEPGEYVADIKMGYGDRKYKKKITVILKSL